MSAEPCGMGPVAVFVIADDRYIDFTDIPDAEKKNNGGIQKEQEEKPLFFGSVYHLFLLPLFFVFGCVSQTTAIMIIQKKEKK